MYECIRYVYVFICQGVENLLVAFYQYWLFNLNKLIYSTCTHIVYCVCVCVGIYDILTMRNKYLQFVEFKQKINT